MERQKESTSFITYFLIKAAVIAVVIYIVLFKLIAFVPERGGDMRPKMGDGDLLIVWRPDKEPGLDDVVAANVNGEKRILRCVAKGGDVVNLTDDGVLLVNGTARQEEIYYPTTPVEGGVTFPYEVPEGSYFLLGDFRTQAKDSRLFGAVKASNIVGTVLLDIRRSGF